MSDDNLVLRGGVWHISARHRGSRLRKSTGTSNIELARRVRDQALGIVRDAVYPAAEHADLWRYLRKCRHAAIARDRARGRDAALSLADLDAMFERSRYACELTGIAFSLVQTPGTRRRPFAPSIDRIDTALPYSLANCRLVCVAVNVAINAWGEDVFERIAVGLFAHRKQTQTASHRQMSALNIRRLRKSESPS